MRPRTGIDRLSGVDVRAAVRRTRLPFVASLLLAALLGAPPAAPPAAEPLPVAAAVQAATTVEQVAAEPVLDTPEATPAQVVQTVAAPKPGALVDQAVRAARTPRAPPHR
jgi:hypothetical protein